MNKFLKFSYFLLFIVFSSCQIHDKSLKSASLGNTTPFLPVIKVVDGDTFWVDNDTEKGLKIRFIGIDAPESRRMFSREVGYYGKEAKKYLSDLLRDQKVRLVSDVDPLDRYGRTLAYVYLEDGTFVNAELVKNGYAVLMTVPPNVAYVDHFTELQREAREKAKGLWNKK